MAIEKWNSKPVGREKAGLAVATVGGTGLGLWFLAGLIPFVSLPMLLVIMVIGGFVVAL